MLDVWKWLAANAPDWVQGELAQEKEQSEARIEGLLDSFNEKVLDNNLSLTLFNKWHNKYFNLRLTLYESQEMLNELIDCHYGTATHHIGDGDGISKKMAARIREYWKDYLLERR